MEICFPFAVVQSSRSARLNQGGYMFEGLFQPMHMLVVFGIALLVFGPKKLPELGKGLGESIRGFKSAMAAKEESRPPSNPD
jgi:sec-independent protein translocase protein TatA